MATYWVRADGGGNDSNAGTSYATAKATIAGAFAAATSQGDKVYIVNDGVHTACTFGQRKTISTGFVGTNYTDDVGFGIYGVDPSGNPAMATVAADYSTSAFYFVTTGWNAAYLDIQGIKFDWTDAEINGASETFKVIGYITPVLPMRIKNCYFKSLALGGSWNDTGWYTLVAWTSSGSAPRTDTVEISYCVFENSGLRWTGAGNINCDFHHNVFLSDADGYAASTTFYAAGGAFFDPGLEYGFYNNTAVRFYKNVDDGSGLLSGNVPTEAELTVHSNVLWFEAGGSSDGRIVTPLFQGYSSATTAPGTGTLDYNLWSFDPSTYNTTTLFDSSGGFGTYQFNEDWRDDGSPTTANTTPNTNDTVTFLGLGDTFNSTGAWTWTTPDGYSHDLPYDLRPIVGRSAGLGGIVPGAIDEAVNAPPVISGQWNGGFFYDVAPGETVSITAGSGLDTVSSDPDGDTMTWAVEDDVDKGTLTLNTTNGGFEYTAPADDDGLDPWKWSVSDGSTSTTQTAAGTAATILFRIVNTTPIITGPLNFEATESIPLSINAASGMLSLAVDPDPQTLLVTDVSTPSSGSLSYSTTTGAFTFTPDFGFTGLAAWTYKVTDGLDTSGPGTVAIQVTAASPVVPPEVITNLIDTAPFFRPTLEVQTEIRFKAKKNRRKHHDLADYTEDVVWEESTHRIINLGTNTSSNITLGGVANAAYLMVETDNPITVSVNGTDTGWPVSGCVIALVDSVTSLYLTNSSTTLTAQVILSVVD